MSRTSSPFAELTGSEKQLKWLEYQTVRLPYVEGAVDDAFAEEKPEKPTAPAKPVQDAPATLQAPSPLHTYQEFQKTRHSQYDAVIARMKQAERKTRHYQSAPLSNS